MGAQSWESMMSKNRAEDDEDAYPFPLVMKKRAGSVTSGTASGLTTPGTTNGGQSAGKQKTLNEQDLQRADEALSHHNGSNGH